MSELKVGDRFTYVTPRGREIPYVVDKLNAETPQGQVMPRARSVAGSDVVYIHDELLAQDWWRPAG